MKERKRQKGETGRSRGGETRVKVETEGREIEEVKKKGDLCESRAVVRGEDQRQAWGQTGLAWDHPGWILISAASHKGRHLQHPSPC